MRKRKAKLTSTIPLHSQGFLCFRDFYLGIGATGYYYIQTEPLPASPEPRQSGAFMLISGFLTGGVPQIKIQKVEL